MPSEPQYATPSNEALQKAKAEVEARYSDPNSSTKAHSVAIGEIYHEGEPTGEIGVVVYVQDKVPTADLPPAEFIPPTIQVETIDPGTDKVETVKIDVQQMPVPSVELLRLTGSPEDWTPFFAQSSIAYWRKCFDSPVPGGVQIAPIGANWVGTLSCAIRLKDGRFGALTNNHVAVLREEKGIEICQPDGRSGAIARLEDWTRFDFAPNGSNRADVAILDTYRTDGPFAPGRHTVGPELFQIGRINPEWVPKAAQKIGDRVQKSGRTTGHQFGKVTAIQATTHVGYDGGTARFTGQIFIRGERGLFSNSGDSGSLVVNEDVKPYGLLFAGGGGITIISPIQHVVEDFGATFF